MAAKKQCESIRSEAAAELLKRQDGMDEFAVKYGEQSAASILALSVDCDSNRMPELHAFLEKRPHLKGYAYLAKETLTTLVQKTGGGVGSAKLIRHEAEAMTKRLPLDSDGPLEQLMVARVVMTWLRLMYAENDKSSLMRGGIRMDQIEHSDRELTRAHNRYVRSIEALARVRKLVRIAEMADTQSQLMKERLTKPAKPCLALVEAKGA
ncbi:MAG TPA: hypothetical protein VF762_14170 [Blastocatellia bacterium]|jgi:hypothetical protein